MILLFALFSGLNFGTIPETNKIKQELVEILEYYDQYDLDHFKREIGEVLIKIDSFERNEDPEIYRNINEQFELIRYAHAHVLEMTYEREQLKGKYFEAWDRVFYLKKRVDNLFIFKVTGGSLALNIEQSDVKVRKKAIFNAYSEVYNFYMKKLKGTNECDYISKIDHLLSIQPVLIKCEELLIAEDTKALEKELRQLTDIAQIEQALLSNVR